MGSIGTTATSAYAWLGVWAMAAALVFSSCSVSAQEPTGCAKFRTGKITYPNLNAKYSMRTDSTQESYNNGRRELVWKIQWLSDCTYELTCQEILVANSPFQPGDRIRSTIVSTDGNCCTVETVVYTKAQPEGQANPQAQICVE